MSASFLVGFDGRDMDAAGIHARPGPLGPYGIDGLADGLWGDVCGTYDRVASHCKFFGAIIAVKGRSRPQTPLRSQPAMTHQAADSAVSAKARS